MMNCFVIAATAESVRVREVEDEPDFTSHKN